MKFNTGIFDAMFGEKMTIQIKQKNGIMKDVVVTKAWWEKMQKGEEGVFKVVKLGSPSVTAHILDLNNCVTQETWIAGTHIKLEDMEKCSENGSVFVLDYYDKGIPQRKVVSRSDWNKAKAHYDQVDAAVQESARQRDDELIKRGFEPFRHAGSEPNAEAQNELGSLYEEGKDDPEDFAKARQWFEKAAAQGNAQAQCALGMLYFKGQGVPQDYATARLWFEKAAAQGNAEAQNWLGSLYAKGWGVPQDYAMAQQWWEKSAAQGDAWAQCALGAMYEEGEGVPQDYVRAYMWYNLAAAQMTGDEQKLAADNRDKTARRMTPAQIAEAQRLSQQFKGC